MFDNSTDGAPEDRSSLNKLPCVCPAGSQTQGQPEDASGSNVCRMAAAEALGTALLVALTCVGLCAVPVAAPLHRALAGGLVVTLLVQCFDHVSGAMLNPTVTLAAWLRGRLALGVAAALCAAQLAGAVAGAGLLRLLAPPASDAAAANTALCLTLPASHVSVYKAVSIEAVLGGCLALANCASWDARNRLLADSWPARVGLIVAGLTLAAGELTGASMNPARSFGPALWAANFDRHWVYWLGPLGGSLLCAALYALVWPAPPRAPPRAPERAHPHPHPRPHPRPRAAGKQRPV